MNLHRASVEITFVMSLCFLFSPLLSADTKGYVVDTGDTIRIHVYEEEDLSFEIKIDETGLFAYPYMDALELAGRTTESIERGIREGLRGRVLINPNVSVSIVEYRNFSIGGEVEKPGSYTFEPGLTVKKAINLSGGLTEWASRSKFDLERAAGEKILSSDDKDLQVYPGDTLTIPQRRF